LHRTIVLQYPATTIVAQVFFSSACLISFSFSEYLIMKVQERPVAAPN